jgi:hypothetical protein
MATRMNSPLSGRVNSGFGGSGKYKNKVVLGAAMVGIVPFVLSTFAASVTVGNGALEFGQGSQQAVACDPQVYAAISEEWFSKPTPTDASAGYFRVKALTVANVDLVSCRGKKLRVRLIDTQGAEIPIGLQQESRVLQLILPDLDVPVNTDTTTNPVGLGLTYLTGDGRVISGVMDATASISTSGTSIYDGSDLRGDNADVTFYLDPTRVNVNIDGQIVGRTTVETVNNAKQ